MVENKSVEINMRVWRHVDKDGRECIKMASSEGGFTITTVNERDGSERCHKNLFMKLRRVLKSYGRWTVGGRS